ncbi:HIT family protein [Streptomyces sp. enrichment culture]|uniref:HIT family protein n=1 Tax=Streptomyces sp. enrichment culture TaxID=1795815 RepID=UPI003F561443
MSEIAEECDFCSIARGEADAEVVFDSADNIAFMPLNPATPGHLLVIPKGHFRDIWELDASAAKSLIESTLIVAHGLRAAVNPQGLNMINSSGAAATQTVFHLHVHLVPRWEGDRLGNIWPPDRPLDEVIREELADEIRSAVAAVAAVPPSQL